MYAPNVWNGATNKRNTCTTFIFGAPSYGSNELFGKRAVRLFFIISTSLKPLNRIQGNLTESKITTSYTKFVFFGSIVKISWRPWPLVGLDIYDFSSKIVKRDLTKLDGKKDLKVLSRVCVCVFGLIAKPRLPPYPLIGWDLFEFSSETAEENLMKIDKKQNGNVLYLVCVFGLNGKPRCRYGLWLASWDSFNISSETDEQNSTKLDRKQFARSHRSLPSLCFSG